MLFVLDTRLFPALALIRELGRRAESCAGFVRGKHNWRLQCQCLCEHSLLGQKCIPKLCPQTAVSSSIPKFSCFAPAGPLSEVVFISQLLNGQGMLSPGSSPFTRNYLGNSDAAHVGFSAVIIVNGGKQEQKCVQNTCGTSWCILEHQNQVWGLKSGFSQHVMRWEGARFCSEAVVCFG